MTFGLARCVYWVEGEEFIPLVLSSHALRWHVCFQKHCQANTAVSWPWRLMELCKLGLLSSSCPYSAFSCFSHCWQAPFTWVMKS